MSRWAGEVGQEACLLVPSEARAGPSTAAPGYFSLTSLRVSWRVSEAGIHVWRPRNSALGKYSPKNLLLAVLFS